MTRKHHYCTRSLQAGNNKLHIKKYQYGMRAAVVCGEEFNVALRNISKWMLAWLLKFLKIWKKERSSTLTLRYRVCVWMYSVWRTCRPRPGIRCKHASEHSQKISEIERVFVRTKVAKQMVDVRTDGWIPEVCALTNTCATRTFGPVPASLLEHQL